MHRLLNLFNTKYVPGLSAFEAAPPFSEQEAWLLFRLAAFGEAVGWALLLIGIGIKYRLLHGNDVPVRLAGSVHGMVFLFYGVMAALVYPSLRWSRAKAVCALVLSVPPFGTLLFERLEHYRRSVNGARQFFYFTYLLWACRDGLRL